MNPSNRHSINCSYPAQPSISQQTTQPLIQSINSSFMSILESMNNRFGMIHPTHPPFNQSLNQLMNQSMVQTAAIQSAKHRRSRHIKTNHAMRLLQQSFVENSKPSKDAMRSMTQSTGCTYADICRWFRNKRHKVKKDKINYQSIKQLNKSNKGSLSQQSIDQAIQRSSADDLVSLIGSGFSSTPSSPSSRATTVSHNTSGIINDMLNQIVFHIIHLNGMAITAASSQRGE